MKADGNTFRCEPCKQIIVFFEVSGKPFRTLTDAGHEYPKKDS
jgi:hypothetical protein